MDRRRALWMLGLATLAMFAVLVVLDVRMRDAGGPGIVTFEFAGSEEEAGEILADWGEDGKDAARWSLWLDYPYLVLYGAFFALAIAALRDFAAREGWRRTARVGTVLVAFPIAAAAFDAIENVGLLLALGEHGGDAAPRIGAIFATAKFALIIPAQLYVLGLLLARGRVALSRRGRGG